VHAVTPSQRAIPADLLDPKNKNRSRLFYMVANLQVGLLNDSNAWALLLDPDGHVAEGTGANFFIVSNGSLLTPEPRNVLCGISREYTMELARGLGVPVRETNLTSYEVTHADEAFYTGTPFSILPCTRFNGSLIGDGQTGPVTARLIDAWSKSVGVDIVAQARDFALRHGSRGGANPYQMRSDESIRGEKG
jgi:branched-chain amino acid aminotransferase